MARRGTIYTYSIVHSGIEAFQEQTPYLLAVVEENRHRRMARVEGYTEKTAITIGMEVTFLSDDERGNPVYTFA
ncbi:MAG: OB-fold domain-containing protein [Geobacteraceae bacterium]|nr:OB-fold domain-containing protein [Geobacteraceae bacterium]